MRCRNKYFGGIKTEKTCILIELNSNYCNYAKEKII